MALRPINGQVLLRPLETEARTAGGLYIPESARELDPLMGWTSSSDMRAQVKLRFATKEEAIAYAEREGVAYRVEEPKPNTAWRRIVSYADNFKPTRKGLWTH